VTAPLAAGKFFALVIKDELVVKLPRERVNGSRSFVGAR
jgi:hypothetical protein